MIAQIKTAKKPTNKIKSINLSINNTPTMLYKFIIIQIFTDSKFLAKDIFQKFWHGLFLLHYSQKAIINVAGAQDQNNFAAFYFAF